MPMPMPTPTRVPMQRPCGRRAPSAGPIAAGGRRTEERRRCCLGGSWNRDSSCRISPSWLCIQRTAPLRVRRRGAAESACVRTLRGLAEATVDMLAVRSVRQRWKCVGGQSMEGLAEPASAQLRAFLGRLDEGAKRPGPQGARMTRTRLHIQAPCVKPGGQHGFMTCLLRGRIRRGFYAFPERRVEGVLRSSSTGVTCKSPSLVAGAIDLYFVTPTHSDPGD